MKALIVGFLTVGTVVGGGYAYIHKDSLKLPFPRPAAISSQKTSPILGKVAGLTTQIDTTAIGDKVNQVVQAAQKAGNAVGIQTIQTGGTVISNVTSTPSNPSDVVDVSQAVNQIKSQVQQIPATLVKQAQIEYCRQVLLDASSSAAKQ
jgi:hypothetical protein